MQNDSILKLVVVAVGDVVWLFGDFVRTMTTHYASDCKQGHKFQQSFNPIQGIVCTC